MSECQKCHTRQPEDAKYCDNCGHKLAGGEVPDERVEAAAPSEATLDEPVEAKEDVEIDEPASKHAVPAVCPNCDSPLEPDSNYCDQCGNLVAWQDSSVRRTRRYPGTRTDQGGGGAQNPGPQSPGLAQGGTYRAQPARHSKSYASSQQAQHQQDPSYYGAQQFNQGIPGRLVVQGVNTPIPFPPGQSQVYVGREAPMEGKFPEIDLTNYGADQGGVSRLHARIYVQGGQVMVVDNDSLNHTYVNGQMLSPGQPHPLNDGDEIKFGRVKLNYCL